MGIDDLATQRILVTGGAGFIGSELVHQLVAMGAHPLVVDNLTSGNRSYLDDLPEKSFSFHHTDIRDKDVMVRLVAGMDLVLHLACLGVRHSIHSPIENQAVNATATLEMLEIARTLGVRRFIYVSSSEVYGTAITAPMSEQHPTWPMTVYGAAKLAGERYTDAYWRTYRFPTTVVRPFNAYGPRSHHEGDSGEVIPKFMLRAMAGRPLLVHGDGTQTRDFTFVSDTARGILLAAASDHTVGETINLGQGVELSINDLAQAIGHVVGRNDVTVVHSDPRPGDVLRLFADASKAQSLLSFTPRVSLHDGLIRLRDWYRSGFKTPEELLSAEVERNWISEHQHC
jgi:UDP-glucose 4-epimerase